MKVKSLYIKGDEKYVLEILEEVKKRLSKEKIWIVEINPDYETEGDDED